MRDATRSIVPAPIPIAARDRRLVDVAEAIPPRGASPRVTVAIPAFNAGDLLAKAVASALRQTWRDLEVVVVDDGSTDDSIATAIRHSHGDRRLRVVRHEGNRGLAATRNALVDEAQGRYIAWLDADDIAMPDRIERQVAVLDADPGTVLCAALTRTNRPAVTQRPWHPLTRRTRTYVDCDPRVVRASQLFGNVVATSASTVRADALRSNAFRFNAELEPSEDYDVWTRLGGVGRIRIVPEILACRTELPTGASATRREAQRETKRIIQRALLGSIGVVPTTEQEETHVWLGGEVTGREPHAPGIASWLEVVAAANAETGAFDPWALSVVQGGVIAGASLRLARAGRTADAARLATARSGSWRRTAWACRRARAIGARQRRSA